MKAPFVTRELAQQLELSEAAYYESRLRSLQKDQENRMGVQLVSFGHGVHVISAKSMPDNWSFNRVMGLRSEDERWVSEILSWFQKQGIPMSIDIVPALVDPPILRTIASLGFYESQFMTVVYMVPDRSTLCTSDHVCIRKLLPGETVLDFGRIFSQAFNIPEQLLAETQRFSDIEHLESSWNRYLAYVDGKPAAIATLYLNAEASSISAMGTAPSFRRKGCQTALLDRCISDCMDCGSRLLVSQVRPSSQSETNMVKAGFAVAYTKGLWVRSQVAAIKSGEA